MKIENMFKSEMVDSVGYPVVMKLDGGKQRWLMWSMVVAVAIEWVGQFIHLLDALVVPLAQKWRTGTVLVVGSVALMIGEGQRRRLAASMACGLQ